MFIIPSCDGILLSYLLIYCLVFVDFPAAIPMQGQAFRPSDNKDRIFSVFNALEYSDSDDDEDADTAPVNGTTSTSPQPGLIRRLSELPELWRMHHSGSSGKLSHLRTVSFNTNIKKIPGSVANVFTGMPSFRTARANKVSNANLATGTS